MLPISIALQIQERDIHSNQTENLNEVLSPRYLTFFPKKYPKHTMLGSQWMFINFYLVNFYFFNTMWISKIKNIRK